MTHQEFAEYLEEVRKAKQANKSWRIGQTYFNVLYDLYPKISDQYCSSHFDPFYDDNLIGAFLVDLYANHVDHPGDIS